MTRWASRAGPNSRPRASDSSTVWRPTPPALGAGAHRPAEATDAARSEPPCIPRRRNANVRHHRAPVDRRRQADGVRLPRRRRGRGDPQRGARRHGRQARPLPRPRRGGTADAGGALRALGRVGAVRARVAQRPGGRRVRRVRPRRRPLHASARARGRSHRPGEPRVPARLLPGRGGVGARFAPDHGGLAHRRRRRLARAQPRGVRRVRALLPDRLQRQPAGVLAPCPRRGGREARARARRWPTSAAATAPRRS